ncbi:phycobilisome protein [Rubidibacter lacunae KORDI 51-2]|uniref:Phycobilisome protein n=1 Tax=Rubidibacter lacunae KORDI 51-2 TaxID=582515 RepID=U5DMW1_9CHRO|nr:phycobilisome protein [Rubidibacter lacunae]ERN41954.1 phycobilisome protein [Rubidibacter lacunae KORDI 51-2]
MSAVPPLSDRAKQLIPKARIVSFARWEGDLPPEAIARLQAADDAGRFLDDDDLEAIFDLSQGANWQNLERQSLLLAGRLRDTAAEIVAEAREQVLESFPGITEPGGGLHPKFRADACWRDFWHFLRCITYGTVGDRDDYLSQDGLHHMNLLYCELRVPLPAMIFGIQMLQQSATDRCSTEYEQSSLTRCARPLREALLAFKEGL